MWSCESARRTAAAAATAALLTAAACGCSRRQAMHDQPRHEPFEASGFFADGMASRPLVPGTVARGAPVADAAFATGMGPDSAFVRLPPVRVDAELLRRGQERFEIYCTPCHDRLGSGRGMVVRRGYAQPPSFHIERLRGAPLGYFFDVTTRGFGRMPSYAAQVPPHDRWAIAAYIRALQLSQHAPLAQLPPEERRTFEDARRARPAAHGEREEAR